MKTMVKAAKDRGMKLQCDDCHTEDHAGDWTLRSDARDRFAALRRR
jgi:hypothetical protein